MNIILTRYCCPDANGHVVCKSVVETLITELSSAFQFSVENKEPPFTSLMVMLGYGTRLANLELRNEDERHLDICYIDVYDKGVLAVFSIEMPRSNSNSSRRPAGTIRSFYSDPECFKNISDMWSRQINQDVH